MTPSRAPVSWMSDKSWNVVCHQTSSFILKPTSVFLVFTTFVNRISSFVCLKKFVFFCKTKKDKISKGGTSQSWCIVCTDLQPRPWGCRTSSSRRGPFQREGFEPPVSDSTRLTVLLQPWPPQAPRSRPRPRRRSWTSFFPRSLTFRRDTSDLESMTLPRCSKNWVTK